ncbi:FxSxx-COOH cyclophane-containing RiPP peptide [Streptomyces nondiastaticus]|uniref:FxSxx-COOH cyclophane-containing RiPP peptide n=1 Tax=Actinomycetes TaxID=1760 RepID=UPI0016745AA1|nr:MULTISPECIES: FxSxx-COOH cyclophane-containing RiPP peptide [Actinomycetes]WKU48810.1 FxSxx-COOH cyclophane-containing RiPP peptide [Streptomyces sp. VNUA116]
MTVAEDGAPGLSAPGDTADAESVVVDLVGLDLEHIAALPDSVLGSLLRRIHDTCAAGDPFVTGHRESQ